uniref:Proteophosphoglycan ppg4 n=1 Tax=Mycena chlorophos TaxID=658473 RepID=A0ABQ0MBU3_MYCCL|nr:predicted protein [Mycena chlorophos]
MNNDEDPLAAALASAFVSSPSLRPPTPPEPEVTSIPSESTIESSVTSESFEDSSQSEYEAHVAEWRAQSAEQREKAEAERAKWEAIRAAEKQEAALRKAALPEPASEHGWEPVGSSPSPADARDLVSGEHPKTVGEKPTVQSAHDTGDESQKWEEVSEPLTSSFPSMSFPDRTNTPSPHHDPPAPQRLESATTAIFDPSLSARTRITALFSSLAINLFLPFVNGVMLGFGEIFAKNVVLEYFGWRPLSRPGSVAASVGLRTSR